MEVFGSDHGGPVASTSQEWRLAAEEASAWLLVGRFKEHEILRAKEEKKNCSGVDQATIQRVCLRPREGSEHFRRL